MKTELSDGERTLMTQLWEHPGSAITELTAAMRGETGWSKHAILSMLARMEAKSAFAYEQSGRAKAWYPLLRWSEAVRKETRRFLDKVYGGSVGLMVNAMADSRDLSPKDIEGDAGCGKTSLTAYLSYLYPSVHAPDRKIFGNKELLTVRLRDIVNDGKPNSLERLRPKILQSLYRASGSGFCRGAGRGKGITRRTRRKTNGVAFMEGEVFAPDGVSSGVARFRHERREALKSVKCRELRKG